MVEGFMKPGVGGRFDSTAGALKQARMLPYKTSRNQPKTTARAAGNARHAPAAGWLAASWGLSVQK